MQEQVAAAGVSLSLGCDVILPECMASSAALCSSPGPGCNKHHPNFFENVHSDAESSLDKGVDRGAFGK